MKKAGFALLFVALGLRIATAAIEEPPAFTIGPISVIMISMLTLGLVLLVLAYRKEAQNARAALDVARDRLRPESPFGT